MKITILKTNHVWLDEILYTVSTIFFVWGGGGGGEGVGGGGLGGKGIRHKWVNIYALKVLLYYLLIA